MTRYEQSSPSFLFPVSICQRSFPCYLTQFLSPCIPILMSQCILTQCDVVTKMNPSLTTTKVIFVFETILSLFAAINLADRNSILFFLFYCSSRQSCRARRKPMLLFRLSGVLLLRFDTRQFLALLFQLPPRFTRLEPPTNTALYDIVTVSAPCCLLSQQTNTSIGFWRPHPSLLYGLSKTGCPVLRFSL